LVAVSETLTKKENPTMSLKYLAIDTNAKTIKGQSKGYMTGILYLSPANESGKNLCAHASIGCKAACLYTAGRGAMSNVKNARMKKTLEFISDRESFSAQIKKDIDFIVRKAKKDGMTPCIRLNGTSDLPWHNIGEIMQTFPHVQFYDYTPSPFRMLQFLKGELPENYHLTFSRKEDNDGFVETILERGGNVAVVFADELPTSWKGKAVVNGDETDLRFLDGKNVVVGLKAKGKGKKDESGFVVK
jgi:hypothetical protein